MKVFYSGDVSCIDYQSLHDIYSGCPTINLFLPLYTDNSGFCDKRCRTTVSRDCARV